MTMYRFITLLWSGADREAEKAADYIATQLHEVSPHRWEKAWNAPGMVVFHSGEHKGRMQTYRLQDNGGVVLGRLFHNDYSSQDEDLNDAQSRACIRTKGQHLIDEYWGRYVAFLNDGNSSARYVIRDPSGAFPCFHTSCRGVDFYFSDMQDAANFDSLLFTVNWDYLKTNIKLPQFQKTHTGLNEVDEVLPAELVEITQFERKHRFLWDPTKISQTEVVEDPEAAATLLRETVKNTIGALAGCYDRIVHNLGGLDSSILLACIADAPKRPDVTCINYFTKSPRGEERYYSRQVAERVGVPLVESELDYRKTDLNNIFRSNKLASPLGFFDCIGLTGDVVALAKEKNAQAIFYGIGGDNVFYQIPRNLSALDYVNRHGFGKQSLKIAMEGARYGRRTLTSTIRSMLRERFFPVPCYRYVDDSRFDGFKIPLINPEVVDSEVHERFLHPLLLPDDSDPKGKFMHMLSCAFFAPEYYDHWDTSYFAERVNAYLTQPIVEVCLRIPTWVLAYRGIERGLARKAFRNDLPQDIILRRSKSTPSEYYRAVYEQNRDFIREMLLDGVMVQRQFLLRNKLEKALSKEDLFLLVEPGRILGFLATEVWLRGWMERPVVQPDKAEITM